MGLGRLLPWSVLMKTTDEEVRRLAGTLARDGDQESIVRFLILGSLRYDREQLEEMLEISKMGLVEAILEGSSLVQEVVEKAVTKALAEGRTTEARRSLCIVLKAKFPGLETAPEIDSIASTETLESLLETAVTSTDRSIFEQALAAAVRVN